MTQEEIFDFCIDKYAEEYTAISDKLIAYAILRREHKPLSKDELKEIENTAQLQAIQNTMTKGLILFPDDIPTVWNCIYKAHLYRKSGISDPEIIQKAISASQSWKSSSGHAFEAMVKELGTNAMAGTSLKYILQKDLKILLDNNELANGPTEKEWLRLQVNGDVFDVFVIGDVYSIDERGSQTIKPICFGCVQCKTSIRDRVSRDVVPSTVAMSAPFWSITFVLDGTMLSVPKYRDMVNGNPNSEFQSNGWHGVYVLSAEESRDRIYAVDSNFDIVRRHTIKAFADWTRDRMGFRRDWRAEPFCE